MSAKPADQHVEDTSIDAEVAGLVGDILEEHGSETAALKALEHDFTVLLADADRPVSRGDLRSRSSQGARPIREHEP